MFIEFYWGPCPCQFYFFNSRHKVNTLQHVQQENVSMIQCVAAKDRSCNPGYLPIFQLHSKWLQCHPKTTFLFPVNFAPGFMGRKPPIPLNSSIRVNRGVLLVTSVLIRVSSYSGTCFKKCCGWCGTRHTFMWWITDCHRLGTSGCWHLCG